MNIAGSVVFVTGASRGLGLALAKVALAQGASKVYAGVRNTEGFDVPGIIPVKVDVTDAASVLGAAEQCQDTTVLVNNAGIGEIQDSALAPNMIELTRRMMDTNTFGIVRTAQAFAPILARNGGGAIVNVLSDVTWLSRPMLAAYAASKSAAWSVTNALRLELTGQKTQVVAVHVGFVDTDLVRGFDVPKTDPRVVAEVVFEGVNGGALEVLVDEGTRLIKSSLSLPDAVYFNPQ
ncbi:SDR family oxidoreductase [Pseudomonas sp. SLFW]|uniref:SDR family oxidoreductase n=1 Tax=Pseudomonas sp. SLFW TaxID=2683259 RepID=UPI0014131F06|nr:SDR family oxidoreductase [Pseudomonas sp. SLFW]NBB10225.1 SDR family NAD(P)-dependent oxidoreductase [Pseudomonas sp. SLFW]